MNIGLIGLGRMGSAVAARLAHAGIHVFGFDAFAKEIDLQVTGKQPDAGFFTRVSTPEELVKHTQVIWLFVPSGQITDDVINQLVPLLTHGTIIIDGGNSNYKDSLRRYQHCKEHGISFLDCGTSGGVAGRDNGFSLMIGGDEFAYHTCVTYFSTVAAPRGFGLVGPAGAGHYVKMIHNGIEYGLLQAYAEGLHLLKDGHYQQLNLAQVTEIWEHSSVIRSWLLSLIHEIYARGEKVQNIDGRIAEGGTGRWTVEEAREKNIPVDIIARSLEIRAESRQTGGNYATKLIQLIRHAFGGHPIEHLENIPTNDQ